MNVNQSSSNGTRWLAGVVFLITVGAYVLLELNGGDTTGLYTIAGPVIASLFVVGALGQQIAQRTTKIEKGVEQVQQQTNGVLDDRIRHQVHAALSETMPQLMSTAYATQPHQSSTSPPPAARTLPDGFVPPAEDK